MQIWIVQRRANSSPFLDNELQPNCERLGKIQARTYNDAWKIWERMNSYDHTMLGMGKKALAE